MISVRPPAVAGLFYPAAAAELRHDVEAMLAAAAPAAHGKPVPKAIIAPHAGYVYSGPIAAAAYARLGPARPLGSSFIIMAIILSICGRYLWRYRQRQQRRTFDR